jgi:zinc transport system permease protein
MITELLQYVFFRNAVAACVLAGLVCGLVGTYIVSRRMVFLAGGMAHASLGGVGVCALAGWSPMAGAAVASLLAGWGVQSLAGRREVREDSAIAMLWALGMSLGIMCSYLAPDFLPGLSGYLFGNILLVGAADLWALGALALVVAGVYALCMPQIVTVSFDAEFAKSRRQPVAVVNYMMISLVALSIVGALKVAGVVLVISLLSVPQMTANLFCSRFSTMAALSSGIAVAGCLCGLAAAVWLNVPCGVMIVAAVTTIYIVCRTIKRLSASFERQRVCAKK